MSLRSKLEKRAAPYVRSSERAQAVFPALSGPSPYWSFLLGLILYTFSRQHTFVVTDQGILVLDSSMWNYRPKRLRLRHPRNFYFGQMKGLWGSFVLDDTKYFVHMRFHKDVAAADAALGRTASTP